MDLIERIETLEKERDALAARVTAAEFRADAMAAENAYLLPKAASELSNAWVLHKYLIGIQAAIMHLDDGSKKAAQEWLYGTIAGPGFEFPDEVEVGDDIDALATHQLRGSISHSRALEIIKAETPATDAWCREMQNKYRCEGINFAASRLAAAFEHGFIDKPMKEVGDVVTMILGAKEDVLNDPAEDGLSGKYAEDALKMWEMLLREAKV